MFGFPLDLYHEMARPFIVEYKCFSVAMLAENERENVDHGGKIFLPQSALDHLTRLHINYPMMFKLRNKNKKRMTHAGVLEFIADEGKAFIPYWMMKALLLDEGDTIIVENVTLPVGTYSKFLPHSPDFLEISNPKAVLENFLRNFACLTAGDVIDIPYNNRVYEVSVLETQPGSAINIIECDMNVDFAPPVGYVDPADQKKEEEEKKPVTSHEELIDQHCGFYAFKGKGNRLDGKKKREPDDSPPPSKRPYRRGIPDYDFNMGEINFIRDNIPPQINKQDNTTQEFKPFSGQGLSLKKDKEKE